jgi:aromatic-L-amino-acid/L-tryptophan decarboxylase
LTPRLAELRRAVADPLPHPTLEELRSAAGAIQDWALNHYQSLPDQPIGATPSPAELRASLDLPPPDEGRAFADVLADFRQHIEPNAFRVNHPRFMAFVPGAPCFPSILGDWLSTAANFFCGVWLEAAGPAQVESTVLDWFRQWLGMPDTTRGVLTSGGSEANLTALVVARERVPLEDRQRIVLYVAEQRHWSVDRAAKVMGLLPSQIIEVPVDRDFRMRGKELWRAVERDLCDDYLPWAVVANAGATNTGTVDALDEIAQVCREEGMWLHIDAAYGWAAVLCESGKKELAGIELADSITLDPHKWLAQAFDVGCVLIRDGRLLPQTFATRPDYLQDVTPNEGEVNYADHGIALTRRFRALKIWVSMQMLGLNWFRRLAEHGCALADYAQAALIAAGCFEILCPRRLSIVCFRYVPTVGGARSEARPADPHAADPRFASGSAAACIPQGLDDLNTQLLAALRDTGRAFLSSTRLRGAFAVRMCFINWRTSAADVDEVIALLVRLGADVAASRIVPNVPTTRTGEGNG